MPKKVTPEFTANLVVKAWITFPLRASTHEDALEEARELSKNSVEKLIGLSSDVLDSSVRVQSISNESAMEGF